MAHVVLSLGWLGAVLAYLPFTIIGLTSTDPERVHAAYFAMKSIGWFVIVPLCAGALLSGLFQSLSTEWGLFRHYWIIAKLALTAFATLVLLSHLPAVSRMAAAATSHALPVVEAAGRPAQFLVHAVGGAVVLVVLTMLSTFKPWGRTPWSRR